MLAQSLTFEPSNSKSPLLEQVLSPYIPTGTDYLKSSQLIHTWQDETHSMDSPLIKMKGDFCIPNSCYIKATGHFNAVEFLICYNQLAYSLFAEMVNESFFNDPNFETISPRCQAPLSSVSIESYLKHQLSSMLILKASTRFRSVIDAHSFSAILSVNRFNFRSNTIFIDTSCVFSDNNDGKADGSVLLAYPMTNTIAANN